jgi:hypothetical protein
MKTDNIEIVEQVAATDPTQKTIQDYSITELKALVYDSIAIIEENQNNIKFINEELSKRTKN